MTLCTECQHVLTVDGKPNEFRCGAIRYRQTAHPVTAEKAYILGGKAEDNSLKLREHSHPYCNEINKGNCDHFKWLGE